MDSTSEFGALIIEAAASGDLKKLKAIRRKVGDDTEFRKICDEYSDFSTGRTVLHHAAEIGHFQICKFLIQNVQVYVDASTYRRDTPLLEAAKGGHAKIVEYLIDQGSSVSLANSYGYTALHFALFKDNRELMELLLIKGAAIEADSVEGTPLQCAASRGNAEAVKLLLSRGAEPNCSYSLVADLPLVCAVKARSFECMELLLKAQADPNMYFIGLSPLSFAAKEGDTRFLKTLLEAGADPNSLMTVNDIFKPIEDAALAHNREGLEILFPLTEPLEHYPEWTVDGIMEFCHSEEFKTMLEDQRSIRLSALDNAGLVEACIYKYNRAIIHYRMASHLDPSNPEWISKQSMCHAHAGRCMHAMIRAEECLRHEPRFPAPHHGGDADAEAEIFQRFLMAGLIFAVDHLNKGKAKAFGFALFDYFAWLIQMSSGNEILCLYPDD